MNDDRQSSDASAGAPNEWLYSKVCKVEIEVEDEVVTQTRQELSKLKLFRSCISLDAKETLMLPGTLRYERVEVPT